SLETANRLTISASGLSTEVSPPCPGDIALALGGSYDCRVVFEMPMNDMPATLKYAGPAGSASASFGSVVVRAPSCKDWGQNATTSACSDCLSKHSMACLPAGFRADCGTCAVRTIVDQPGCFFPGTGCATTAACSADFQMLNDCVATA